MVVVVGPSGGDYCCMRRLEEFKIKKKGDKQQQKKTEKTTENTNMFTAKKNLVTSYSRLLKLVCNTCEVMTSTYTKTDRCANLIITKVTKQNGGDFTMMTFFFLRTASDGGTLSLL